MSCDAYAATSAVIYVQTEPAICDDHHGSDRAWAVTMYGRNLDSTAMTEFWLDASLCNTARDIQVVGSQGWSGTCLTG